MSKKNAKTTPKHMTHESNICVCVCGFWMHEQTGEWWKSCTHWKQTQTRPGLQLDNNITATK